MGKTTKSIRTVSRLFDAVLHDKKKKVSAVIVAAGNSTRMGEYGKKQILTFMDQPVVLHTLRAFENCAAIDEIVLVTDEYTLSQYPFPYFKENGISKLSSVVLGGSTRAQSVENGFFAISKDSDLVAIHDGARCLITPEQIARVVSDAARYGSAIAGCRSTDTLKKIDDKGFITETPDREKIWRAQTPQVFDTKIYTVALALAKKNGTFATDDAVLVKNAGFSVKMTELSVTNIKITTPDDLPFVEQMLMKGTIG